METGVDIIEEMGTGVEIIAEIRTETVKNTFNSISRYKQFGYRNRRYED